MVLLTKFPLVSEYSPYIHTVVSFSLFFEMWLPVDRETHQPVRIGYGNDSTSINFVIMQITIG